jgi:hypothetical protein
MIHPKISRRQAYLLRPLHELFNEGGLDIDPPSKRKWFGLKLWLFNITGHMQYREAKRLYQKYGTHVFKSRTGLRGLL